MDYMEGGSLADLIEREQKGLCPSNYNNTKRQIILIGIARGMMILHKHHVIHRDLKPENILLDSDLHPYITDFGLSKFFDPQHSMNQSMSNSGTAAYMAPEVIKSDHFNTKADVYAFGILMYEVLFAKRAYDDILHGKKKINDFQLKTKVNEGYRPKIEDGTIKKGLKLMIEKCWSKNPLDRPTFEEIFKKLSLSKDDYFLEFEGNVPEPKIIDEDEEDEEENMLGNTNYCLDSVDFDELLDYIYEINEEATSLKRQSSQKVEPNEIEELKKKIEEIKTEQTTKISKLEEELAAAKREVSDLKKTVQNQSSEIYLIRKKIGRYIYAEMNLNDPGILQQLKKQEKSLFDKFFIASQSTRDIYNVINPKTNDDYASSDFGDFYIEFTLNDTIAINGIKIVSSWSCFPKSFDIEIDGTKVKSIQNAALDQKNKSMIINFDKKYGSKVKIIQTGPNSDHNNNFILVKHIDLLSTEAKYSKGVFASLIDKCEDYDPHKCPVYLSSERLNFNSFYLIDSKRPISTAPLDNSWFQVELTRGFAILEGFRLKRCTPGPMRCYKIIATDDSKKEIKTWTTLIEIEEKTEKDHKQKDIYQFSCPSPPVRFIRLIQTGPAWDGDKCLAFMHIDFFGTYY